MKNFIMSLNSRDKILLIVLVVLIIYVAYRTWKKRTGNGKIQPIDSPNVESVTSEELSRATVIAEKLHEELDGLAWNGHNLQVWQEVGGLSNRDLSIVNRVFNEKYGSSEKLVDWINDEYFIVTWDDIRCKGLATTIVNRLNSFI